MPVPRGVFFDKKLEFELLFNVLAFEYAQSYAHNLQRCTVVDKVEDTIPRERWPRSWRVKESFHLAPTIFGEDTSYYEYGERVTRFITELEVVKKNIGPYAQWVEAGRPLK